MIKGATIELISVVIGLSSFIFIFFFSLSQKKETYRLGERPCRSAIHFLVRLYLVSIIEHAKAWLAEEKKKMDDDDEIALIQALTT